MAHRKWEPGLLASRNEWFEYNGEVYMCRYGHYTSKSCSPGPNTKDLWYDPKDPLQNDYIQPVGV